MKNKFLRFLIGVLFFEIFIPVLSAQTIQTDSFELFVAKALKDFDIPGLSVAIVKHDSVLYTKGFGVRDIMGNKPVDENTIFGIGSISKSFTALALGILVDEGKINWDDKVDTYLPYFKLYDPYVSDNFTIRDLLTHRSGLNEVSGGALWYHSDYSRKEIIERLQFLKPVSGFREKHAYQNVMYLVASEIVKAVSGMSWDDFLRIRVFEKLYPAESGLRKTPIVRQYES